MTKAIETAIKLLETLPEPAQEHLVEELRRLALEAQDDAQWEKTFERSETLKAAVEKARQNIAAGISSPFDFDKL
jgi:predicted component of type VI protein secretion system